MKHLPKHTFIIIAFLLLVGTPSFSQPAYEFLLGNKQKYNDVVIKHVDTVATFVLEDGERVRMIGLRAPDLPQKEKVERKAQGELGFVMERERAHVDPTISIEQKAFDFVQKLLEGKRVRLETDDLKKSDDNRTLAYVYLLDDETFVNAEILRQGYAYLSIRPPNTKHADTLRDAYRESTEERRGLQGQ